MPTSQISYLSEHMFINRALICLMHGSYITYICKVHNLLENKSKLWNVILYVIILIPCSREIHQTHFCISLHFHLESQEYNVCFTYYNNILDVAAQNSKVNN